MNKLSAWWNKEAEWWQFWYPQSGVAGGYIAAVLIVSATLFIKQLLHDLN